MLADLRRRQFPDSREFVDRGLGNPKEFCDLHHGQDFPVPCGHPIRLVRGCCRSIVIHDT